MNLAKILHHRVLITDGGKYSKPETTFEVVELNILGENSQNIVVDDLSFTTISKTKNDYATCLDKKHIGITANDHFWGNRISYSLYSVERKSASKIKKEIQSAIDAKFGFYSNGIDLGFIKG